MTVQQDILTPAANPAHLPYLLRLLDDESPVVRGTISREFCAFGEELDALLDQVDPFPAPQDRVQIQAMIQEYQRLEFRRHWRDWYAVSGDMEQLEAAFGLVANFMSGSGADVALKEQLDQLAQDFAGYRPDFAYAGLPIIPEDSNPGHAAVALADFLFKHVGIKGAIANGHLPENSDLLHCLREREGLPISLVCIYMLVGHRLGIGISACNWPGHFLARINMGDTYVVVDCFREGACVPEDAFLKMQGPSQAAAQVVLNQTVDAETIMLRVLNNLAHAYQSNDDDAARALMIDLRHDLERHLIELQEG